MRKCIFCGKELKPDVVRQYSGYFSCWDRKTGKGFHLDCFLVKG